MSRHPGRSPEGNRQHDLIVHALAKALARDYNVLADHVKWSFGTPPPFNGHVPDLLAIGNRRLILEVECCQTFNDPGHSRSQLEAFASHPGFEVYCVVPALCQNDGDAFSPVNQLRKLLAEWGLSRVRVATFDRAMGRINWQP